MAFEKRENKGYLFVNKEKKTKDHPSLRGYLVLSKSLIERMLKHKDFEINLSLWTNEGKEHNNISVDEYQFNKRNGSTNTTEPVEFDGIPM